MFSQDSHFNINNYNAAMDMIRFVQETYMESMVKPISLSQISSYLSALGVINPILFETFTSPFRSPITPFQSIQSIIAMGGIISGSKTAVIAFRGTSNNVEWINDFQSMNLISLPTESYNMNIGSLEPLAGIQMSMPSIKIGDGFLRIYSSRIGQRTLQQHCVCKTNCFQKTCLTYSLGRYSQIEQPCTQQISSCNDLSAPSLQNQIYNFLLKSKCDRVLLCGHSLGGALANICAFHLKNAFRDDFIHSVYAIAPPRTGNTEFAKNISSIQNRYFTIINSNDMVPNVPLPLMPTGPACFSHVGHLMIFSDFNTNIPCDINYIWYMHSLDTYRDHGPELIYL